ALVGARRGAGRAGDGLAIHAKSGMHALVQEGLRLHVVAFPRPGIWRMVRLSQSPRRGFAPSQRRQMERLLPRPSRAAALLENIRSGLTLSKVWLDVSIWEA